MASRRYSIVIADRQTRRRSPVDDLPLWPTLGVTIAALLLPVLMGLGARWSASASTISTATTARLQVENASYREATGQLASQISALQTAVDELGATAAVDPAASRAMDKLPAIVKSRAMGGGGRGRGARHRCSGRRPTRRFGVLRRPARRDREPARLGPRPRRAAARARGCHAVDLAGRRLALVLVRQSRAIRSPAAADFHPGLDISADHGQPVLAPATAPSPPPAPAATTATWSSLDHGFGIVTKYGHLSRFAVDGRPAASSAATSSATSARPAARPARTSTTKSG